MSFLVSQGLFHALQGPLRYAQDAWTRWAFYAHVLYIHLGLCLSFTGCGDPRSLGSPGLSWVTLGSLAAIVMLGAIP